MKKKKQRINIKRRLIISKVKRERPQNQKLTTTIGDNKKLELRPGVSSGSGYQCYNGLIVWYADLRQSRCIGFIDFDLFPIEPNQWTGAISGCGLEPKTLRIVRVFHGVWVRPVVAPSSWPLAPDEREITEELEKLNRVCYSKNAGCKSKPDTIYPLYKENSELLDYWMAPSGCRWRRLYTTPHLLKLSFCFSVCVCIGNFSCHFDFRIVISFSIHK